MRKVLVFMLITFACTFMCSREAKATVEVITQVSYYEPTNSIFASAETFPDYETLAYYDVGHFGYVRKDETVVSEFYGENYETEVYYSDFFPYDPDADYAIEVYPSLVVKYRHSPGDTYADYYNYVQWANGVQVQSPYNFGFTGPGPEMGIGLSDILLGYVFSIFTDGGTSGPPHHLRVIHDNDVIRSDLCGQIEKRIQFQIVDQQNRAAGQVAIDEKPANLTDTCSGTTVAMSTCANSSSSTFGNFTDGSRTGCPHIGPTPCGFDLFNRWRWCKNTSPYTIPDQVDLAVMYYWTTRTFVKIDGEADMQDLTYKYP